MLSRNREPFGKAGLTVAVVALVMALVGGAYAAGGLTGKQKKEVTKIAKKYAGKPGTPGAPGPAGAQGPKGDTGAKGADGAAGSNGSNGTNGVSVTTTAIPTSSATCNHNGGVEVKSATPTQNVCNGITGFTKTLPKGETETGTWSFGLSKEGIALSSISFNIPVAAAPTALFVETPGEEPTSCPGSLSAPDAAEGFLCIYLESAESLIESRPVTEVLTSGANLVFFNQAETGRFARGTWAVTAE